MIVKMMQIPHNSREMIQLAREAKCINKNVIKIKIINKLIPRET